MSITHLFFDADHTIFDFDKCQTRSLQKAFNDCEIDYQPEYGEIYTRINKACWKSFEKGKITREQLKSQRMQSFCRAINLDIPGSYFHDLYAKHLSSAIYYFEGAESTLHQLSSTYQMVLITNGLAEIQRPRLEKSSLLPCFDEVIISGEIGYTKPDRKFFKIAMEKCQYPAPKETLVIGDNLHADIRGGKQMGMLTAWFNPDGLEKDEDVQPDYEFNHWNQLNAILAL